MPFVKRHLRSNGSAEGWIALSQMGFLQGGLLEKPTGNGVVAGGVWVKLLQR